jgi:hypothetical protein
LGASEICTSLEVKKLHKNLVSFVTSFLYIRRTGAVCIKGRFWCAFRASPIHEVLIDKALMGWKEYELG